MNNNLIMLNANASIKFNMIYPPAKFLLSIPQLLQKYTRLNTVKDAKYIV